jgi:phosphoglycerate dehydrogenase-like enzyme
MQIVHRKNAIKFKMVVHSLYPPKGNEINLLYINEKRHPDELRNLVRQKIRGYFSEWSEIQYGDSDAKIEAAFENAELLFMAPGRCVPEKALRAAKNLKMAQVWSSGYDKVNIEDFRKHNIIVANNGGANAFSVAEHAILLALSVMRKLPEMHMRTKLGNWEGNGHGLNLNAINNKSFGIIGLGAIGSKVAKIAQSFDCNIFYYDLNRNYQIEKERGYIFKHLIELVEESDIISLHLHLNNLTIKLMNEDLIKKMKKNAILINVSREQLVDMDALSRALRDKNIRGYGTDVFEVEPTLGSEEILTLENVVVTPHIAGSNLETYELALENSVSNLYNYSIGLQPKWIV